jgi:hypothetical protein
LRLIHSDDERNLPRWTLPRPTLHMFINRLGLQSWLTQSEGEAADCTARRSSASGTAHATVPTTANAIQNGGYLRLQALGDWPGW